MLVLVLLFICTCTMKKKSICTMRLDEQISSFGPNIVATNAAAMCTEPIAHCVSYNASFLPQIAK